MEQGLGPFLLLQVVLIFSMKPISSSISLIFCIPKPGIHRICLTTPTQSSFESLLTTFHQTDAHHSRKQFGPKIEMCLKEIILSDTFICFFINSDPNLTKPKFLLHSTTNPKQV